MVSVDDETKRLGRWVASSTVAILLVVFCGTTTTPNTVSEATRLLTELRTAVEDGNGYNRSDYEHNSRFLCDTAGADPYTGLLFVPSTCQVDHVVAAKEAHESGGHAWDDTTRAEFGNDVLNLVASRDCVNQSKGSRDTAEWFGVQSGTCGGTTLTSDGQCFWATRTIQVKHHYDLAVDIAERAALKMSLTNC